jgi:cobalt/nickel transport system ATP-binding protein
MSAVALHAPRIGYAGGPAVLRDVHLDIEEGESVAVLGGNGAGKTALLRTLVGLVPAPGARVELNGRRVGSPTDAVAAGAALVLQDPDDQLLGTTLLDDVLFGPRNLGLDELAARRAAGAALASMRIAHLADRPIEALSFGERKRACIAGMLAMRPRVLLLDEPTAGLDPDGQERLLATLDGLRRSGTTVVMATHDVDLALRWADDAALLTPAGARTGPVAAMLARTDLLEQAGLRLPWGIAVTRLLREQGLLTDDAPGPRTPDELAALAGAAPPVPADG